MCLYGADYFFRNVLLKMDFFQLLKNRKKNVNKDQFILTKGLIYPNCLKIKPSIVSKILRTKFENKCIYLWFSIILPSCKKRWSKLRVIYWFGFFVESKKSSIAYLFASVNYQQFKEILIDRKKILCGILCELICLKYFQTICVSTAMLNIFSRLWVYKL